ncbi:hypothetical protein RHMOL_Rhmol03G0074800 [Rhododendron molle]|uniref:Uncharacterized protein n=1 Tax=Rhododendron molle TaxID=49168 RepID=A0ACC0PCT5_RHOML|nr:hypothetical protein RHMOL_Rhmol03G0074800 [Rhododendron molle]
MGKKMKFPFLFKTTEEDSTTTITAAAAASWQWPSCGAHKTLSFRAPGGDVFKTMNSAYDTAKELEDPGGDPVEAVISGLRTAERLFFEPGETSSILGELKTTGQVQICPDKEESSSSSSGGGVLVAMDSMDPYKDFKTSMEEMVEADGLKEWDRLEELLGWYLKANGKENHGYIVAAFVDLLVGLAFSTTTTTTTTTTTCSSSSTISSDSDDRNRDRSFSAITSTACSLNSPLSFSSSITTSSTSTTPCLSSSLEVEDEIHDKTVVDSNGC